MELFRPAKPPESIAHPDVVPAGVYFRDGRVTYPNDCNDHAENVAGVMISSGNVYGGTHKGVVVESKLAPWRDAGSDIVMPFNDPLVLDSMSRWGIDEAFAA